MLWRKRVICSQVFGTNPDDGKLSAPERNDTGVQTREKVGVRSGKVCSGLSKEKVRMKKVVLQIYEDQCRPHSYQEGGREKG